MKWWGSLGISAMLVWMLEGGLNFPFWPNNLLHFVEATLIFWPFVAFAGACVAAYWEVKDEQEERRLRNTQPVAGPPPDHEYLRCPQCGGAKVGWSQEYERIFCWYCRPVETPQHEEAVDDDPFLCPICGSTNAKRLSDIESICYDCRPVQRPTTSSLPDKEPPDDEELTALLRELQPTREPSRSDDDYAGRSLPQLRLEDIKDTPPLSHEELMDSVRRFRARAKK